MAFEEVVIGDASLILGDCREVLPTLTKVDAVITDPPYGKVKGEFDEQWTNRPAMLKDAAVWLDAMIDVMKPNATLWWFAWPSLAGRIEAMIAEKLNPLAHVVWEKQSATGQKCRKEGLRAPMPLTERILMAEHYGADNMALGESGYQAKCDELRGFIFEPLRAYICGEFERAGMLTTSGKIAANVACGFSASSGGMASRHYFSQSQWQLPTPEHYNALRWLLNGDGIGEYLRRDYEDLRRDYEDLRRDYEDLRRWFDCRAGDQFSDIWRFPPCREDEQHPTRKPVQLMNYLVRLSVRPGGIAVDPFMGSGTTGVACMNLGRKFIGIEIERRYFDIACERISRAQAQGVLFLPDAPPAVLQCGLI